MHDMPSGPLHAGVRPLLARLADGECPPAAARLDRLALQTGRPHLADGRPVSFAPCPADRLDYEMRVATTGCVATRDASWHDTFNACVWLLFPRCKAAMNRRHVVETARTGGAARGRIRDALTQFDEDGMVVLSDDRQLLDALRHHRWREALWERRTAMASASLFVFGHALLEKALAPHRGLCAKVRYAGGDELGMPAERATTRDVDAWLAAQLDAGSWPLAPRDLYPLPVLGLPGMTEDNVHAAYFDDASQFRPLPAHRVQE
jgi:hypothetical protein